MGKRKEGQVHVRAEAKKEKVKTVTEETVVTSHDDHPVAKPRSGELLNNNCNAKGNYSNEKTKEKKSKTRKKVSEETEKDSNEIHEPKGKKIIFVDDEPQVVPSKKAKKRNKALQETEREPNVTREPKGKKTVFSDDEAQEASSSSGDTSEAAHTEKKKRFLNDDEAEVREEDIDKFCDELCEEDNAQYEEWVKLVEANFHSNKKKHK